MTHLLIFGFMKQLGVLQRVNLPPKGRDEMTDDADNTPSQSALMVGVWFFPHI
jgi:hypothetical protein